MPFTLAHPAVVVPIYRMASSLSLPALVIGSLSPDVAYFIPMGFNRLDTHSALAILWFCLPVSLLIYVLFYIILAPVLVELGPKVIRERLATNYIFGNLPVVPWQIVAISSTIGAVTHILWDSFTHANGALVQVLTPLQTALISVGGYTLTVYKILQHGSSLIGMGVLLFWIVQWLKRPGGFMLFPQRLPPWYRIGFAFILFVLPLCWGLLLSLRHHIGNGWLQHFQQFLGHFVVDMGGAFIVCWLSIGIIYRIYISRMKS